ncbi:putative hippocampus abundant transcript-like protein 1, partial [Sesbania bispinosa]
VAAILSMIAAVYMRIFLKESVPCERQPLLRESGGLCENNSSSPMTTGPLKRLLSVGDLICLLKS